jgi:polar amino acid transport system substrate-binding protein
MLRIAVIKSFLFILVFCLATGCTDESNEDLESTAYKAGGQTPELVVGISPDNVPFEFVHNSQIVGFDIDLINSISKKLKMNFIIKDMQFYLIIPSLKNGDIHVAISGISETPERAAVIDFSTPYYHDNFAILSIDNLDPHNPIQDGMKIGVQNGTLMHQWIMEQNIQVDTITKFDIISMDSNLTLIEALKNKKLDGILMDQITASSISKSNVETPMVISNLKGANTTARSIGLQKNDPLLEKINSAIHELHVSGEISKMKKEWGL